MLTRVPPRLPPEQERKVYETIGCAIRVHKALGPGFQEGIYHDAMRVELTRSQIPWRSDLVVIELKTVDRFHPIHTAQVLSYMKAAGLPIGLLMNFKTTWLRGSIRRFVL